MTNLNVEANELSIDDLGAVAGGEDFEMHFTLFGYRFGVIATDTANGQMTCTSIIGPGHKIVEKTCILPG